MCSTDRVFKMWSSSLSPPDCLVCWLPCTWGSLVPPTLSPGALHTASGHVTGGPMDVTGRISGVQTATRMQLVCVCQMRLSPCPPCPPCTFLGVGAAVYEQIVKCLSRPCKWRAVYWTKRSQRYRKKVSGRSRRVKESPELIYFTYYTELCLGYSWSDD